MSDAPVVEPAGDQPMTIADLLAGKNNSVIEQLKAKMAAGQVEKLPDPKPVDMEARFKEQQAKLAQEQINAPADLPIGTQAPRVCPCCGWMVNEFWHPEFPDELKIDFQEKVIYQGGRWTQSYPLFGGKMTLELRTLTGMEQRVALDLAINLHNPPRLLDVFRYEIACAVSALTRGDKREVFDEIDSLENPRPYKEVADRIQERVDKLVSRWTVPLYGVIQRQYNKFEITHTQLTSKAPDLDFWPATL